MIKRDKEFIEVAFFLSKFGKEDPPRLLKTARWKDAYRMFYEELNGGRDILTFEHSLKNSRDMFDSHFTETNREGWKEKDGRKRKLTNIRKDVFEKLNNLSEIEIWNKISKYAVIDVKEYNNVFDDLTAIEESEQEYSKTKTEGGTKVYISQRIERNPKLRKAALKIHGYNCMVCNFNFYDVYGEWGKDFAEVHHIIPLSESKDKKRDTDPKEDLAVLCANCHRMIHRRKGTTLTVLEKR